MPTTIAPYRIYRFISKNTSTGTESTHTVTGTDFEQAVRRYYAQGLLTKGETLILWHEI